MPVFDEFFEVAEIEITAIHDIDGPGLDDRIVEDVDIVNVSGGRVLRETLLLS